MSRQWIRRILKKPGKKLTWVYDRIIRLQSTDQSLILERIVHATDQKPKWPQVFKPEFEHKVSHENEYPDNQEFDIHESCAKGINCDERIKLEPWLKVYRRFGPWTKNSPSVYSFCNLRPAACWSSQLWILCRSSLHDIGQSSNCIIYVIDLTDWQDFEFNLIILCWYCWCQKHKQGERKGRERRKTASAASLTSISLTLSISLSLSSIHQLEMF